MDLALSEALARVQTWETQTSYVNGMVLSDTSQMMFDFAGCVTIQDDVIRFTGAQFEFRLALAPSMAFKYGDGVLEVRASGWRCVLYEPKP